MVSRGCENYLHREGYKKFMSFKTRSAGTTINVANNLKMQFVQVVPELSGYDQLCCYRWRSLVLGTNI